MDKKTFARAVKNLCALTSKHAPELLTGLGIAGMLATTVMAVKATPKAAALLEAKKTEQVKSGNDTDKNIKVLIKVKDTIMITWKLYIPSVVTCAASIACLIGANAVNAKRSAAITAAYALSETAFHDYREKVVETVGDKKEELIHADTVQTKIDSQPPNDAEVIITNNGTTLCYDAFAGRYFYSDKNKIEQAINKLNRAIIEDDFISLNYFYDWIGLEPTDIGNLLGWNSRRDYVDVRFSSHLTSDGRPCLAISFSVAPRYEYDVYAIQ